MSPIDPTWITDSVRGVARAALRDNQPGYLPILADALEDAGCQDEALLVAYRTPGATIPDSVRTLSRDPDQLRREQAAAAKTTREAKFAAAHQDEAVALGQSYHARIEDLYTSKRGDVVYGKGGADVTDWKAYSKKYGFPANYKTAGARVIGYQRSGRVVLETHRGKEVARLPLPPKGALLASKALLNGDLYAVRHQIGKVVFAVRFGPTYEGPAKARLATGYRQTGVALLCPVPDDCREQGRGRWGIFSTTNANYWEHGTTLAVCRAEYARKLDLVRDDREAHAESDRVTRLAKLAAALCGRLIVTTEDARAVGYCQAGIAGFAGRWSITGDSATVAQLRATGDAAAEKPIYQAALRVARQRLKVAV